MSEQFPSEKSEAEIQLRECIWGRLKEAAQAYHEHPQDHGINTLIGNDAGRSSQTVGDWKHGRSPVPPAILVALAGKYGVSARYLACRTDNPSQVAPPDEAEIRARMVDLVDRAIEKADVEVERSKIPRMCSLAMEMINEGQSNAVILGTLIYIAEGADPDS